MKIKKPFDKYEYYSKAVQAPADDVVFLDQHFKKIRGRSAKVLREDFCAAFAQSCEWVKLGPNRQAYCIDLDPETLEYGKQHYLSQLTSSQKSRVKPLLKNVMDPDLPKADLINALNFSYFCLKKRADLVAYFRNCLKTLNSGGILMLDCFGGSDCYEPNVQKTDHKGWSYYWDQDSWDPVTHEATFHIHFKRKGEKKRENVFTYDWRLWGIREIRDCLEEVGFANTRVLWEGTDDDGGGNGEFTEVEVGEVCDSWIAYILAETAE